MVTLVMRENHRIIDQLRRAVYGDAWHGDALFEVLAGVSVAEAQAKVGGVGHSIEELTLHVAAWLEAAERRIGGDPAVLLGEADWPVGGDWAAAQERVRITAERLLDVVEKADLDAAVPGKAYDNYHLLHGVIQHTIYHAGQIALQKRSPEGMLRHAIAAARYRAGKVLAGAPVEFGTFSAGGGVKTPAELVAHLTELFAWVLELATGTGRWKPPESLGWEADVARFWAALGAVEAYEGRLARAERLLQGPVADALTHIGQLGLLRRMAGYPMTSENYFAATIPEAKKD